MTGTILNVSGILAGGLIGLVFRRKLASSNEGFIKVGLAAFTVFYGLRLTWMSLSGPWLHGLRLLVLVMVAMMLGRFIGQLLGLQRASNSLGRFARERITEARPGAADRFDTGFKACTILFCAAPLGILGSVVDGLSLSLYFYPLAIKAVIDGLASMGLAQVFGAGVVVSALPVLVLQGTLSLVSARELEPFLNGHDLLAPVNATAGLLIFCVALVMLGLKRIALADYLPSLIIAPLLAFWLH